jgi:hypothetical protein
MNSVVSFPSFIPVAAIISVVFVLLFLWWVVYTLVVVYHWFRYARSSWLFAPMLAFHILISSAIFIFIMTSA